VVSLSFTHAAGVDAADATSARQPAPDFAAGLPASKDLPSRPLAGRRLAVVAETRGAGVAPGVSAAVDRALAHLRDLGAEVGEARDHAQQKGCYLEWFIECAMPGCVTVLNFSTAYRLWLLKRAARACRLAWLRRGLQREDRHMPAHLAINRILHMLRVVLLAPKQVWPGKVCHVLQARCSRQCLCCRIIMPPTVDQVGGIACTAGLPADLPRGPAGILRHRDVRGLCKPRAL